MVEASLTLLLWVSVVLGAAAVGALVADASERWGRYELHWDFEDPLGHPERFWTRWGARRFIDRLKNRTQVHMNIRDRRTGKIYGSEDQVE